MVRQSWQVIVAVICAAGGAAWLSTPARAGVNESAGHLRWSCDALLNGAVTRRYGTAWAIPSPTSQPANPRQPANALIRADLAPESTAAAGLVLHMAGAALNDARYRDAAVQVARGLAAAQDASGRVPATAVLAAGSASGRDPAKPVPDRAPTRAALALWLTILQSQPQRDPRINGAATRAATWLLKQQGSTGIWTTGVKTEEGVQRFAKLDDPDYRDNTFAVLLAARVTPEFRYTASADRAIGQLVKMRVQGPHPLWATTYTGEGAVRTENGASVAAEPVNLVATRYAMQTILAHALVTGSGSSMDTLAEAAPAVQAIRQKDGTWPPTYATGQSLVDFRGSAFTAPTTGTFGLPETLRAISGARVLTPAKYVGLLKAGFGFEQQLALALTGLSDLPMTADFPVGASEVKPYLAAHPEFGAELDAAGTPEDVPGRVTLAYRWLVRYRLDAKAAPLRPATAPPTTAVAPSTTGAAAAVVPAAIKSDK